MAAEYDIKAFPRFSVTVDLVALAVLDEQLCVVLIERAEDPFKGYWALPGGFVQRGPDKAPEGLDSAAQREFREETGLPLQAAYLAQLGAYGEPDRDPRDNVVTVAYLAIAPVVRRLSAGGDAAQALWLPVNEVLGGSREVAFDHRSIIGDAVERTRELVETTAVATSFCDDWFTLPDLRRIYEIVWDLPRDTLDPGNFYHRATSMPGFVEPVGDEELGAERSATSPSRRVDLAAAGRGRPPRFFKNGALVRGSGRAARLERPIVRPAESRPDVWQEVKKTVAVSASAAQPAARAFRLDTLSADAPISPSELETACRLYERITDYAKSLDALRASVGADLDLTIPKHRDALLLWLNRWRCRVSKAEFPLVKGRLDHWFRGVADLLPPQGLSLSDADDIVLDQAAVVFDSLVAEMRGADGDGRHAHNFGQTAVAKTLFVLRPHLYLAWDGPMRRRLELGDSGESYARFLKTVGARIRATEKVFAQEGLRLDGLPNKLGRPPYTTVEQLVIEYYWVTLTRGVPVGDASTPREPPRPLVNRPPSTTPEAWEALKHRARGIIWERGRAEDDISYGELAKTLGIHWFSGNYFALLDALCLDEVDAGGPMVTVLVTNRTTGLPGERFAILGERLGRDVTSLGDFIEKERRRAFEWIREHPERGQTICSALPPEGTEVIRPD